MKDKRTNEQQLRDFDKAIGWRQTTLRDFKPFRALVQYFDSVHKRR